MLYLHHEKTSLVAPNPSLWMDTLAVVMEAPGDIAVRRVNLDGAGDGDVIVDIEFSGISTGTERLLWSGRMPAFPGMGYPLVPGYESVGRVVTAGSTSGAAVGDRVFVPGARCFGHVHGLFGGAARTVVLPGSRIIPIEDSLEEDGVLLALAATARHALALPGVALPDLIVGHGVLGRLMARLALALGGAAPTVWETNPDRRDGAKGYAVIDPASDTRKDYRSIYDVSGDPDILDTVVPHMARGAEIVLAGFYEQRPSFDFAPAFRKEMRMRIAAEFLGADIIEVMGLIASKRLSLGGLITHRAGAGSAAAAYETAFQDPSCLKMVLDWREC